MRINNNYKNTTPFNGYGARPLKALVVRNTRFENLYEATKELIQIGKKHNFDVFIEGKTLSKKLPETEAEYQQDQILKNPWIQDKLFFLKNEILHNTTLLKSDRDLIEELKATPRYIEHIDNRALCGGNAFLLENDTVLLGEDEHITQAITMFNPKSIITIPQADFHIDLFIRPLKGKTVLVADDNMTIDILKNAKAKLKNTNCANKENIQARLNYCIYEMEISKKYSNYKNTDDVINTLINFNYNVIRVPGRIYQNREALTDRKNTLNYLNAIVHENPKGELVFITNKSNILYKLGISKKLAKHLGLDFEEIFKNKIKDYINPQNVYFIRGGKDRLSNISNILENDLGGIHCLTLEIPR